MAKILIVDDDADMRDLHKMRLSDTYEILDTEDPEEALGLALEHKPTAILLDLMMPRLSGFELCHTLHTLSYTSRIPIFVITGESAAKYKQHCEGLGASAFFEKPVDYKELKKKLAEALQTNQPERRAHVRVTMRVVLKLGGKDSTGKPFKISTVTENLSPGGFLAGCAATLNQGDVVEVFVVGDGERFAGRAKAVRCEARGAPWQRYGFQFLETTSEWVLQASR
ncbi:MAG: response regulator [Candidatus Acidiferrales bacterium]|jgi:response regulator RpfG family c-di-GMP phosphodiesterase